MYRPNQNKKEESIKLVKIDNNIKGNKRTKKNYHQENMDYLTQIVRNKNKEVKRGGSKEKMAKLLLDNAEIEKLLSKRSKTKKIDIRKSQI